MNVELVAIEVADEAEIINAPDMSLLETRLNRDQRGLSRQFKECRRRMPTRLQVRGLHCQFTDVRRNWRNHAAWQIADRASTKVTKKLNTHRTKIPASSATENPGMGIRGKFALIGKILRGCWQGLKMM